MKKLFILLLSSVCAGVLFYSIYKPYYLALSPERRYGNSMPPLIDSIGVALFYLFFSQLIYWILYLTVLKRASTIVLTIVAIVIGVLTRILFMAMSLGVNFEHYPYRIELAYMGIFTGLVPLLYQMMNRKQQAA